MNHPTRMLAQWSSTAKRQTSIRVAGYVLERTWVHILFFSVLPFASTPDYVSLLFSNMALSLLALTATLLAAFFAFGSIGKLVLSKYFVVISALLCTGGTLVLPFLDAESASGTVLSVTSALATGVGSALLFLGWMRIFGDMESRQSLREYALSLAISYAFAIAVSGLPSLIAITLVALFPLCSGWLLRVASYIRNDEQLSAARVEDGANAQSAFANWGTIRRVAGIAAIGFVAGMLNIMHGASHSAGVEASTYSFAGCLAITGFATILLWLRPHWALRTIHRISPFVLVIACFSFSQMPYVSFLGSPYIHTALTHAGFACYALSLLAVSIFLGRALHVDPLRAICLMFASMYLGEIAGMGVGLSLGFPSGGGALLMLIGFLLVVITLASNLFFFTESDLVTIAYQPDVLFGEREQPSSESDNRPFDVESIGAELASAFQLTPRESEILPLLLKGRTIARIQEELFISASTVNTHVRHIYQKCGVQNKQGLIDLVENYRNTV